jgi:hypothetical protein
VGTHADEVFLQCAMDTVREQAAEEALAQAEQRVDGLIARVQPNRRSIEHRHAVFHYVQHLFTKCTGSRECTVRHLLPPGGCSRCCGVAERGVRCSVGVPVCVCRRAHPPPIVTLTPPTQPSPLPTQKPVCVLAEPWPLRLFGGRCRCSGRCRCERICRTGTST